MGIDVVGDGARAAPLGDAFESLKGTLNPATHTERNRSGGSDIVKKLTDLPRETKITKDVSQDPGINTVEGALDVEEKCGGKRVFDETGVNGTGKDT